MVLVVCVAAVLSFVVVVIVGPRNLTLKFGQNRVNDIRAIVLVLVIFVVVDILFVIDPEA